MGNGAQLRADMMIKKETGNEQLRVKSGRRLRIWVDMASPPQILFFSAVIPQLRARGHDVVATAYGFTHCEDLLKQHNVDATVVGRRYEGGHNEQLRRIGWENRRRVLYQFISKFQLDLAASYGSSTQASVAARRSIPLFTGTDYEYVNLYSMRYARRVMIPDAVPKTKFIEAGLSPGLIRQYPGQKEHVYLCQYQIVENLRSTFGISEDEFVVVFRPEANFAHYLDEHATGFPEKILAALLARPNVRILLMPRTKLQKDRLQRKFGYHNNLQILDGVYCGPSLVSDSDLLVSGGGSMIREATALGAQAASCFEGQFGALDQDLVRQGKLVRIQTLADLEKLVFKRRKVNTTRMVDTSTRDLIVDGICETAGLPVQEKPTRAHQ